MFTIFLCQCSCISSPSELPFKIGVGGLSTPHNLFSSLKLPGIHSCKIKDNITTIYSYSERKTLLNFPNTKFIDNTYQNVHCSIILKTKDLILWNKYTTEDAFLRFYVGEHVKRAAVLDPMTTDKYIVNDYLISIDDEFTDKQPRFLVQPQNSVKLPIVTDEDESVTLNISFIFSLNFVHFDRNASYEPNYFLFATIAVIISAILTTYLIIRIYKNKFPSVTMPQYASIWKIPFFINNTLLFSTSGLILFFTLIFMLLFSNPSNIAQAFINSIFVTATIAIIVRIKIGYIYQRMTSEVDFISPALFVIGGCPFAYQIVNIANNILFNSFRGLQIIKNIATLFGVMMATFFYLRGIGHGYEIVSPFDASSFIFKRQKKPKVDIHFKNVVVSLLYGFFCTILLRPVIDHLYSVLLDDSDFDLLTISLNLTIFCVASASTSLFRTTRRVKLLKFTWQEDHLLLSICVAFFVVLYCFALVLFDRSIRHIVTFAYCVTCGIAIVTTATTLSCCATYFMALVFVKYTISLPQFN